MRLYIDLNCFNRPFDDQRQERVCHETEAVLSILRRIIDGNDSLVWSWALTFENEKHPMPDRRDEIALWEGRAERSISLNNGVKERAKQLTLAKAFPPWIQCTWPVPKPPASMSC
jgi:hypothetical protein